MEMPTDPHVIAQMKLVFSSFCGAAIRLFLRPVDGFMRAVFCVACSILAGWAFTDSVIHMFGFDADYAGGVGAAIGTVGLSVAESVLRGIEKLDVGSFISAWLGKS